MDKRHTFLEIPVFPVLELNCEYIFLFFCSSQLLLLGFVWHVYENRFKSLVVTFHTPYAKDNVMQMDVQAQSSTVVYLQHCFCRHNISRS